MRGMTNATHIHDAGDRSEILLWRQEISASSAQQAMASVEREKRFADDMKWERDHWWLPYVITFAASCAGAAVALFARHLP